MDALEFLGTLPSGCAHACVTSPPYYRLRDYGAEGQIGLEPTVGEYVQKLVAVFREVRRVLRPDGTLWLVVGDTYNGTGGAGGDYLPGGRREGQPRYPGKREAGLKPKDLLGVPWALAFALREDGWWLRQCVVWHKPNAMPESAADRPSTDYEFVFLLAAGPRYYYDRLAVRHRTGGALRAVWEIPTGGVPASLRGLGVRHYAAFPEELAERCIRLSTPEAGVCGACGAPWVREVGREARRSVDRHYRSPYDGSSGHTHGAGESTLSKSVALRVLGWRPSCGCGAGAVPAVVLDPFCGSGTVPAVAKRLGRRYLACDINPEYARLAVERVAREACQLAFPF